MRQPAADISLVDQVMLSEDMALLLGRQFHGYWLKTYTKWRRQHGVAVALERANEALVNRMEE